MAERSENQTNTAGQSSGDTFALRALESADRMNRSLSPWVREMLGSASGPSGSMVHRLMRRRTQESLSFRSTLTILRRFHRIAARTNAWKADVGTISPNLFEQFSDLMFKNWEIGANNIDALLKINRQEEALEMPLAGEIGAPTPAQSRQPANPAAGMTMEEIRRRVAEARSFESMSPSALPNFVKAQEGTPPDVRPVAQRPPRSAPEQPRPTDQPIARPLPGQTPAEQPTPPPAQSTAGQPPTPAPRMMRRRMARKVEYLSIPASGEEGEESDDGEASPFRVYATGPPGLDWFFPDESEAGESWAEESGAGESGTAYSTPFQPLPVDELRPARPQTRLSPRRAIRPVRAQRRNQPRPPAASSRQTIVSRQARVPRQGIVRSRSQPPAARILQRLGLSLSGQLLTSRPQILLTHVARQFAPDPASAQPVLQADDTEARLLAQPVFPAPVSPAPISPVSVDAGDEPGALLPISLEDFALPWPARLRQQRLGQTAHDPDEPGQLPAQAIQTQPATEPATADRARQPVTVSPSRPPRVRPERVQPPGIGTQRGYAGPVARPSPSPSPRPPMPLSVRGLSFRARPSLARLQARPLHSPPTVMRLAADPPGDLLASASFSPSSQATGEPASRQAGSVPFAPDPLPEADTYRPDADGPVAYRPVADRPVVYRPVGQAAAETYGILRPDFEPVSRQYRSAALYTQTPRMLPTDQPRAQREAADLPSIPAPLPLPVGGEGPAAAAATLPPLELVLARFHSATAAQARETLPTGQDADTGTDVAASATTGPAPRAQRDAARPARSGTAAAGPLPAPARPDATRPGPTRLGPVTARLSGPFPAERIPAEPTGAGSPPLARGPRPGPTPETAPATRTRPVDVTLVDRLLQRDFSGTRRDALARGASVLGAPRREEERERRASVAAPAPSLFPIATARPAQSGGMPLPVVLPLAPQAQTRSLLQRAAATDGWQPDAPGAALRRPRGMRPPAAPIPDSAATPLEEAVSVPGPSPQARPVESPAQAGQAEVPEAASPQEAAPRPLTRAARSIAATAGADAALPATRQATAMPPGRVAGVAQRMAAVRARAEPEWFGRFTAPTQPEAFVPKARALPALLSGLPSADAPALTDTDPARTAAGPQIVVGGELPLAPLRLPRSAGPAAESTAPFATDTPGQTPDLPVRAAPSVPPRPVRARRPGEVGLAAARLVVRRARAAQVTTVSATWESQPPVAPGAATGWNILGEEVRRQLAGPPSAMAQAEVSALLGTPDSGRGAVSPTSAQQPPAAGGEAAPGRSEMPLAPPRPGPASGRSADEDAAVGAGASAGTVRDFGEPGWRPDSRAVPASVAGRDSDRETARDASHGSATQGSAAQPSIVQRATAAKRRPRPLPQAVLARDFARTRRAMMTAPGRQPAAAAGPTPASALDAGAVRRALPRPAVRVARGPVRGPALTDTLVQLTRQPIHRVGLPRPVLPIRQEASVVFFEGFSAGSAPADSARSAYSPGEQAESGDVRRAAVQGMLSGSSATLPLPLVQPRRVRLHAQALDAGSQPEAAALSASPTSPALSAIRSGALPAADAEIGSALLDLRPGAVARAVARRVQARRTARQVAPVSQLWRGELLQDEVRQDPGTRDAVARTEARPLAGAGWDVAGPVALRGDDLLGSPAWNSVTGDVITADAGSPDDVPAGAAVQRARTAPARFAPLELALSRLLSRSSAAPLPRPQEGEASGATGSPPSVVSGPVVHGPVERRPVVRGSVAAPGVAADAVDRLEAGGWRFKRTRRASVASASGVARALSGMAGGSARPLPLAPRTLMERVLQRDFAGVRVQMASVGPLGIEAAARGNTVYLSRARADLSRPDNLALLGHELTHIAAGGDAPALVPGDRADSPESAASVSAPPGRAEPLPLARPLAPSLTQQLSRGLVQLSLADEEALAEDVEEAIQRAGPAAPTRSPRRRAERSQARRGWGLQPTARTVDEGSRSVATLTNRRLAAYQFGPVSQVWPEIDPIPTPATDGSTPVDLLEDAGWRFKRRDRSRPPADPVVQRSASALAQSAAGGMPLPARPRTLMERVLQRDFSGVRLQAAGLEPLGVEAAARGETVYLQRSALTNLERPDNLALLGHELTHVAIGSSPPVRRSTRLGLDGSDAADGPADGPVLPLKLPPVPSLQRSVAREEAAADQVEQGIRSLLRQGSVQRDPLAIPPGNGPVKPRTAVRARNGAETDAGPALPSLSLAPLRVQRRTLRGQPLSALAAPIHDEGEGAAADSSAAMDGVPTESMPVVQRFLERQSREQSGFLAVDQTSLSESVAPDSPGRGGSVASPAGPPAVQRAQVDTPDEDELEEDQLESQEPDWDRLAEKIYPLIKRMVMMERERRPL